MKVGGSMQRPKPETLQWLRDLAILDQKTRYVRFDPVWYDPGGITQIVDMVYEVLLTVLRDTLPDDLSRLVLLSPINTRPDLGAIPIAVLLSQRMGCRFAVWKEYADVKWGSSAIIGVTTEQLECIVLQHVVRHGTSAARIAQIIERDELHWDFKTYLAILYNDLGTSSEQAITDSLHEVKSLLGKQPTFYHIIAASELI